MDLSDELLNSEEHISEQKWEEMYKEILESQIKQGNMDQQGNLPSFHEKVAPTPGICLKTKNIQTNEKVFINVCTSSNVPSPPDITETQLADMIASLEDENAMVDYRIPMSIGEPHAELDKQDKGCTAYDIIINPNYLHKIKDNDVFMGFFTSVVLEGILNKYNVELERNWVLLKRKKFVGRLQEQHMKTRKLIQEVQGNADSVAVQSAEKPKFQIMREPETGHPEFLIAEIQLPKANRAKFISLDVGEDRLVMHVKPQLYSLDIFLPYKLNQVECGSQFNVKTKVLTVTMPVCPL